MFPGQRVRQVDILQRDVRGVPHQRLPGGGGGGQLETGPGGHDQCECQPEIETPGFPLFLF